MNQNIHYTIEPLLCQRQFQVTLTVDKPSAEGQLFRLPAWIPGSYMIRDFARHIVRIEAHDLSSQTPVELVKVDKSTWRACAQSGPLQLTYWVYAWDLSVRGAHCDSSHAFFNGTSVFLCPVGQEESPIEVTLKEPSVWPEGMSPQSWQVATTLAEKTASRHGFGVYQADNYDELVDHPVEMGNFELLSFEACGVLHEVAITGRHDGDLSRLQEDLQRVCAQQLAFFGQPYPMQRYVFLLHVLGSDYGGLEHRSSTSLHCSRHELPQRDEGKVPSADYCNLLELCSHEYFHTWHVKRIKPAVFLPYDLEQESHTQLLWVFEGFTRYYEGLMLVRSGVIDESLYLQRLSELMTVYHRSPGRKQQTLLDSSFDAWTKLYKADENAPNAIISYYTKGGIVAFLLDCKLRLMTEGKKSLDDVMKRLWSNYGAKSTGIGEDEMSAIIEAATGVDCTDWLRQGLATTEALEIDPLVSYLGLQLSRRLPLNNQDRGGDSKTVLESRANLGLRGKVGPAGLKVEVVLSEGAAESAGIAPGDLLLAVAGLKVPESWEKWIAKFEVGAQLNVVGFRGDELKHFTLTLQETEQEACELTRAESLSKVQQLALQHWLRI